MKSNVTQKDRLERQQRILAAVADYMADGMKRSRKQGKFTTKQRKLFD